MVLGDALRLGAIGVAIGVPLAMVATRLIEVLLEGTHQGDPVVYGLTIAGVLSVTIVAGMAAARRAIRVSVIAALRSD
jgi:ABC-type antimicrobial peptide transport system permease subunit